MTSHDDTETFLEDLADLLESAEATSSSSSTALLTSEDSTHQTPSVAGPSVRSGPSPTDKDLMTSLLPKEVLGPLVLEALNGFLFLTDTEGKCVLVSVQGTFPLNVSTILESYMHNSQSYIVILES